MSEEQVIAETIEAIKHLLTRKSSGAQGAILADLLAMWLAGHFAMESDPLTTQQIREEMLAMHLSMVWKLVPVNAKILGTDGSDH